MQKKRRILLTALLLLSVLLGTYAQTEGDSIEASLLTCSPGTEVYSIYGHTGLRICNLTKGTDVVYNYGVFNFRRPHFTWHFVLGECDYEVMPFPFEIFLEEYRQRGSSVVEQRLNLSAEEANRLYALLVINCLPENRTYRYNFLLNNCTTRARDIIEDAVMGTVMYEEADEHPTYRELLHRKTEDYPWEEVGNDLLLGAKCDTVLSDRAAQFLPEQLMLYMAQAQVYDEDNNRHPLVTNTTELVSAREQVKPKDFPLSPLVMGMLVVLMFVLVALLEYAIRHMLWGFDILVMLIQGLAGVLLCFMAVFSHHPTVTANWQIWILNPIPLFCIVWVVRCAIRRKRCLYHYLNLLCLVLFIVFMPWIPQDFSALTLPLALALLTRPVSYYIYYNRKAE